MPTVLVVDDNQDLRQLLHAVLLRRGFDVIAASGPRQAILAAEQHPGDIDVALVDVILPEMACGECVSVLRRCKPDLKLIYMSGYPREVARRRGALREEGQFVMKPFTPQNVLAAIYLALQRGAPATLAAGAGI